MEPYENEPPPRPTSVRLIKVEAKDETESFICSPEMADLSVPPDYIALFYAWGDGSNTTTIVCHGKAVRVTQTLHAALRMLAASSLLVWADALFIDQ